MTADAEATADDADVEQDTTGEPAAAGDAALPEVGYYTDENGLTWQLEASEAARLGYTKPNADPADGYTAPEPAGPPAP